MASMPFLSLSTSPSAGPPATGSSCVFSLLGDDCLCTLLAAVDGAHALVKLDATCPFSRRAGDGAQSVTEEVAYGALLQLTYADTAAVIRKEKESWKSVLRPMQAITRYLLPLASSPPSFTLCSRPPPSPLPLVPPPALAGLWQITHV
jgi:hypothetical protein